MNELKRLTWKYFLEQKIKEIIKGFLIIFGIIFIPILLGYLVDIIFKLNLIQWFQTLIGYIGNLWALGVIISFILFLVGLLIKEWIESNWIKARERAEEKLNINFIEENKQ